MLESWYEVVEPPSSQLWDSVYNYYVLLGIVAGAVTFGLMIFILLKYRSRGGVEPPAKKQREDRNTWRGPIVVIILMSILLAAVAVQTIAATASYSTPPNPQNALRVNVIGQQFSWSFVYPNGKESPGFLVVPADRTIILNVTSRDVYHQFGIPAFRTKTDAIPGRFNPIWIRAPQLGNFTIQCFELCGVGHATMIARLSVVSDQAYDTFLASL